MEPVFNDLERYTQNRRFFSSQLGRRATGEDLDIARKKLRFALCLNRFPSLLSMIA